MNLATVHRATLLELARVRFMLNFGSTMCDNCEGLKAGPGVLATCFQVRSCNFTNVKDETEPRQLRIIQRLTTDR